MSEQKVLLVQDEKSPLLTLKSALAKSGFAVATCNSGFDALDELRLEPGDLVISSASLPDMTGFQLSSLIKTGDATSALPVIIVGSKDELCDSFWKRNADADLLIERKHVEFDEDTAVDKFKKLLAAATFNKQLVQDTVLIPADLSGRDLISSYREVFAGLLMERSVGHLVRILVESVNDRVEFMTRFFSYIKRVFACEVAGLIVTDPSAPWGVYQIDGNVGKNAFEKFTLEANKQLQLQLTPRIVVNGTLADKSAALKTAEVLPIRTIGGENIGAIILGWSGKHTLDDQSKLLAELLKGQMMPVFRALVDLQHIQVLRQQQTFNSSVDQLTGLYNLEFLMGFLQQQLLFSLRQKLAVGLIMVDIDQFMQITSEFGSDAGDMVLATVAQRIGSNVRSSDLLARYSGDQFAVVLPNTDEAGCRVVAEKLRNEVAQIRWPKYGEKELSVSLSFGMAQFNLKDANPETLLHAAKIDLNAAKETARAAAGV